MSPQAAASATAGAASAALNQILRLLRYVPDYVDVVKLSEVVIAAELEAPGLQSACAAIKANEVTIFKTAVGRMAADDLLSVLIDSQKSAAVTP